MILITNDGPEDFPWYAAIDGQPLTNKGHIRRFRTEQAAREAAEREEARIRERSA